MLLEIFGEQYLAGRKWGRVADNEREADSQDLFSV